jgi:intein-encoded DNA endonuclease-like protein
MKKTISNSNRYFSSTKKKEKMIINSVYTSAKVEGSKITKRELREHYKFTHYINSISKCNFFMDL